MDLDYEFLKKAWYLIWRSLVVIVAFTLVVGTIYLIVPSDEERKIEDAKYEREIHPGLDKKTAGLLAMDEIGDRFKGEAPQFRFVKSRLGHYISRDAWVVTLRHSGSRKLWCVWVYDGSGDGDGTAVVGRCG